MHLADPSPSSKFVSMAALKHMLLRKVTPHLRWIKWPRRIHFWRAVPGFFTSRDLYRDMVGQAKSGAHFVEVGSWKGQSAAYMAVEIANSKKKIRFDCVDVWLSQGPGESDDGKPDKFAPYEEFLRNIAAVAEFINPIRLPSTEAAKLYPDKSLDFVFIDAGHDYDNVRADIRAWRTKIKAGGILAGDDFDFGDVKRAVIEAFSQFELFRGSGHWLVRL